MIYRATKEDIWNYRDSGAISQSFLKDVVMKGKKVGTSHSDRGLGSIIDTYLTMPDHVDDFYADFGGNVPTEKLGEILISAIEHLFENRRLTPNLELHKETVLRQAEWAQFDMNKLPNTKWKSILEKAKHWWEFQVDNMGLGKEVVTTKDIGIGAKIAEFTLAHPVSRPFFTHLDGRDYYYQKAIYFEYLGVQCKALLDILIVSHVKRKVVITDLKSIFEATEKTIAWQIKENSYPNQLSFYEVAVESILEELGAVGYEVDCNWLFVPKDIREQGAYFTPVVWPCTSSMRHWARYGGAIMGSRTYLMENCDNRSIEPVIQVMGWEDALSLYKDCMASGAQVFKKKEKAILPQDADRLYFS
jgi:hypothetical protein